MRSVINARLWLFPVPRPRKRQGHRHSGRSTHHRHRPGLFRSMHACDWASKPPAAAAAARGATSGFPSLASLSAPSSSVPSYGTSATSFPSPHDPASAICAWLQSARGGRYTRSVHACEHACDKSARGGRHISHLSYVSPDIRLTYVPLVSSMAYDGASASGLGFLFKSLISTPPGRLGESVATAMEA